MGASRKYLLNNRQAVKLGNEVILSAQEVLDAVLLFNEKIKGLDNAVKDFDLNIFSILGLRNLSGMMGEVFARCVQTVSNDKLQSNVHQDGYPDLLLTNSQKKLEYFKSLCFVQNGKVLPKTKEAFSPFKYGGVEIKATCGSTPSASSAPKPGIGDQRIDLLTSFDWKAHHRETNHLLGILWDFIDDLPVIAACFYSNVLEIEDWGKIVQPKNGGGRTTSVSIMSSKGVKKMCNGWIAVLDDSKYINKLSSEKWIGTSLKMSKQNLLL